MDQLILPRGNPNKRRKSTLTQKQKWFIILAIILPVFFIDRLTKYLAVLSFKGRPALIYLNDFFRFQYAENRGAFLGLGSGFPDWLRIWVMIIFVGVILVWMVKYSWFNGEINLAGLIGGSLIISGGFSNWIDRVLNHGVVVDFMNMGIGGLRTGIFNIADMAIMAGLAFFIFAGQNESGNEPAPDPADTDE